MNNKGIEKPIVPQYVADWYEENKSTFEYSLAHLIYDYFKGEIEDDNLRLWFGYDFNFDKNKPIQTLIDMHQLGYEVEHKEVEPKKEKLYTVEFSPPKNFGNNDFVHSHFLYLGDKVLCYILRKSEEGKVFLDWVAPKDWYTIPLKIAKLTEDEIKENYAWAWSFAKEVTD